MTNPGEREFWRQMLDDIKDIDVLDMDQLMELMTLTVFRDALPRLLDENERLRAALKFYAREKTWIGPDDEPGPIPWRGVKTKISDADGPAEYDLIPDEGETACQALGEQSGSDIRTYGRKP